MRRERLSTNAPHAVEVWSVAAAGVAAGANARSRTVDRAAAAKAGVEQFFKSTQRVDQPSAGGAVTAETEMFWRPPSAPTLGAERSRAARASASIMPRCLDVRVRP